jgi:hypothetical protein
MVAKTDQVIVLPLDTGNTGKMVRAKQSVVGANTVIEYFFIPSSERDSLGNYKFTTGAQAIPIAVHTGITGAAPTGFMFLINPLTSTIKIAIDRLTLKHNFSTTLAVDLIAPIIRLSKITFTGTLSAATITPVRAKTAAPAPQGLLSLLSSGLTVTNVGAAYEWIGDTMDLVTGGAGHWSAQSDEWNPQGEDDEIILLPGEGVVVWSTLAVTTANRKLIINGAWKEFN